MVSIDEKTDPLDFDYQEVIAILRKIYPEWDAEEVVRLVAAMLEEQRRLLTLTVH